MFNNRASTEVAVQSANENLRQNQEDAKKAKEQEALRVRRASLVAVQTPPTVFVAPTVLTPLDGTEHPMKRSKHDHPEKKLPDNFVQRFALNYDRPPETRDPFYDKLKQVYAKNAFTLKGATDTIATDVKFESVHPEEIEQRLYSLMKFGHILEV